MATTAHARPSIERMAHQTSECFNSRTVQAGMTDVLNDREAKGQRNWVPISRLAGIACAQITLSVTIGQRLNQPEILTATQRAQMVRNALPALVSVYERALEQPIQKPDPIAIELRLPKVDPIAITPSSLPAVRQRRLTS